MLDGSPGVMGCFMGGGAEDALAAKELATNASVISILLNVTEICRAGESLCKTA